MSENIASKENTFIAFTPGQLNFIIDAGSQLAKMFERSMSDFSVVTPISGSGEPSGEPYVGYVSDQPAPSISEDCTVTINGEVYPLAANASTLHLPIPQDLE